MASYNGHPNLGGSQLKPSQTCQEFSIRVPKNSKKRYHVMRFNSNLGVDFTKWKTQNIQIKMERENNLKEFKGTEEETPKYGAGSEFGREAREEARRKKYGIVAKKYKPEDQPWILKQGGKSGKKFKGIREGGVSDNTAYYVFTQAGNGIIEAYPLQEWYKFQPIQRYKALSAEEAEEEFGRRNKIINYFHLMLQKRLKNEGDEGGDLEDPDDVKGKKGGSKKKKDKDLKISEFDDWIDSDDGSSDSGDEKKSDDDDGDKKSKKKGKKKAAPKKKKKDSDDEAIEESDDGDEEGRELDYISDSSESASDHEMKANKELKGVAEEDGLRKLLNSESEDEEEENENKKEEEASNSENEESKVKKENNEKDNNEKSKDDSNKKKKASKKSKNKSKNGKKIKKEEEGSSSELSPNSTDSDSDTNSNAKNKPSTSKARDVTNSAGSSRSATPTPVSVPGEKRKLTPSELAVAAAKKVKLEPSSTPNSSSSSYLMNNSESGITEDAVRRYLARKPMTTTELLQKFKNKKTGLSSDQLVIMMTQILKNINPVKQMVKNKMYLSIKST